MIGIFLRLFGIICIVAGLSHVLLGLNAENLLGANLPSDIVSNASLDSQNRFYGAAFMLFGAVSWLSAVDLRKNAVLFRLMMLVFFVGGITRLISFVQHGLPAPLIQLLGLTELLIPPIMLWWHFVWLHKRERIAEASLAEETE